MKFNLKIREIKAALLICSKDETRFVLCGINVELAPGKHPLIIATDGRRLIAIDSHADQEEVSEKKESLTINRGALESVLKLCTRTANCIGFETGSDGKSLTVHIVGEDKSLSFKKDAIVEGNYPAWKQVLPRVSKGASVGEIAFNTVWLADFGRASKLLGADSEALKVRMHEEGGALLIRSNKVSNFVGVLMPCLIEITEWMPLWIGLDEKPKSAEPATPEPAKQPEPAMA